ncbi:MAG: glycosyltransferase family 2 protein [Desulfovibrionaceae bacterium]|nr:glycosyltransferase family 2 protein [Desulfovibrionaceae bacterium]
MKQGFLIPVYNHGPMAAAMIPELGRHGLPIILVDDGSGEETREALEEAAAACPLVRLTRLEKNSGKGAAICAGLDLALVLGLTHVLQVDADGQHDLGACAFFLEAAAANPEAAVCGYPEYDASVPASRRYGREVANVWSRIVTLSTDIKDALCGFRVYPVEKSLRLLQSCCWDRRMGFDADILVRLRLDGVPLIFYPVRVTYPEGGLSHFRPLRDNLRLSWVFARLFCKMLCSLPGRMARKAPYSPHWSEKKEQGSGLALSLLFCLRPLPMPLLGLLTFPVSLFYYFFVPQARRESRRFLLKARAALAMEGKKARFYSYLHIRSFSLALLEKLKVWSGGGKGLDLLYQADDVGALRQDLQRGQGALLICSHLGNMEFLRALAHFQREIPLEVTALVNLEITPRFDGLLRALNPGVALRVLNTADLGPETISRLQDSIASGGLVVIAGDRTSPAAKEKYFLLPFLQGEAPFGQGAFFLAALLEAPVYFIFALRRPGFSLSPAYAVHVHRQLLDPVAQAGRRRSARMKRAEALARAFAVRLEGYCKVHPYQWYNFYDFWAKGGEDHAAVNAEH